MVQGMMSLDPKLVLVLVLTVREIKGSLTDGDTTHCVQRCRHQQPAVEYEPLRRFPNSTPIFDYGRVVKDPHCTGLRFDEQDRSKLMKASEVYKLDMPAWDPSLIISLSRSLSTCVCVDIISAGKTPLDRGQT